MRKFKELKQNQIENVALGFVKAQVKEIDASERTIKTKTKIGEFILDEKLKKKVEKIC